MEKMGGAGRTEETGEELEGHVDQLQRHLTAEEQIAPVELQAVSPDEAHPKHEERIAKQLEEAGLQVLDLGPELLDEADGR